MAYLAKLRDKYAIRYRENGETVTDPRRYDTKAEGLLALKAFKRAEVIRGPVPIGSTMTTKELGERWERDHQDKSSSADSRRRWDIACDKMGWVMVGDITGDSVLDWIGKKDAPKGTIRIVRGILRWSLGPKAKQRIPVEVLVGLTVKDSGMVDPERMEDSVAEEIQKRADALDPVTGAMTYCYQTYAWRPITMGKITIGDVDLKAATVWTIVKDPGGLRRVLVPLKEEMIRRFKPLMEGKPKDAPLFPHPLTGQAFTPRGHRAACVWLGRHNGITYSNKRLGMSRMDEAGFVNSEIKMFTGHKSDITCDRYKRTNLSRARAAADKLGAPPPTPPAAPAPVVQIHDPFQKRCADVAQRANQDAEAENDNYENDEKIIRFPLVRTG